MLRKAYPPAVRILDSESSLYKLRGVWIVLGVYNIAVILFMFIQILVYIPPYVNIWKKFRIQGPELEMRNFLRNIYKQQYATWSSINGIGRKI